MASSVLTRPPLDKARTTRSLVISSRVNLLSRPNTDRGSGVIFIEPVFKPGSPNADPDGFIGFVMCAFQVDRLISALHHDSPDEALNLAYFDDTAQQENLRLLYARVNGREYASAKELAGSIKSVALDSGGKMASSNLVKIGGREWRTVISPNPVWLAAQRTPTRWIVLGINLALTVLVVLIAYGILRRTADIRRQVDLRTQELTECRRQLSSLLADMPGMAYRSAAQPPFAATFLSEGALAITGYPAEEFLQHVRFFSQLVDPADRPRTNEQITAAIEAHRPFEIEYRLRHRDGTCRHLWERGHGVYDTDGNIRFIEGLVVDITARKEAEIRTREFERQLRETQKFESLGVLAGGIAHDFNNILTTVLANASFVRMQLRSDSEVTPQLLQIEHSSRRAADLCAQMLAYAGKGRFTISAVDFSALVRDTTALLKVSIGKNAQLQFHLADALPAINADATQIRQIVMNFVINAAESFGDEPGTIQLRTRSRSLTDDDLHTAVQRPETVSGDYVELEVRDNGSGMSPDILARIFEPFFTTKFSGRGLGLAAAIGIVRSHQGVLLVESTPGTGTTFRLCLPVARATSLPTPSPAPTADDSFDTSPLNVTILVVDDEASVRHAVKQTMARFGAEVIEAADGIEALRIHREYVGKIDLVLLDLTMPTLSGEETLRQLRAQGLTQPVVLMSGYSDHEIRERYQSSGAVAFLAKPFEIQHLVSQVRANCG